MVWNANISALTLVDESSVKELQEISRLTFSDTFGSQNSAEDLEQYLDSAYSEKKLLSELRDNNSYFYFAYVNEAVAGYLKLNVGSSQTENEGDDALEVERIYVAPDYKRRGIGSELINEAIRKASELHKHLIWLGVWEQNQVALDFYKKLGFNKTGKHTFILGQDHQTDFIMKKNI